MVFALFEILLGCFAIFAGSIYYSFGGVWWHIMGVSMGALCIPAFSVGVLMLFNKI